MDPLGVPWLRPYGARRQSRSHSREIGVATERSNAGVGGREVRSAGGQRGGWVVEIIDENPWLDQ